MTDTPADIGHNRAPLITSDELLRDHGDIPDMVAALMQRFDAVPDVVETDEEQATVSALVKDFTTSLKTCEAHRTAEKSPYLEAERVIDGFFKRNSERMTKTKSVIESRLTRYLNQKAAEERASREAAERARREAERAAREEADRKLREALEAEARARAAAQKDRDSNIAANVALKEAVAADEAAERARREADAAQRAADANAANLARTRNESTLATLRTVWDFEITDLRAVPLETLRPFLSEEVIRKAIRGYMGAKRHETEPLEGVRFFTTTSAMVR